MLTTPFVLYATIAPLSTVTVLSSEKINCISSVSSETSFNVNAISSSLSSFILQSTVINKKSKIAATAAEALQYRSRCLLCTIFLLGDATCSKGAVCLRIENNNSLKSEVTRSSFSKRLFSHSCCNIDKSSSSER